MKISTKGRYGIRLMLDLAMHYELGLVPLKEIAQRQEISDKYLEQIVIQLNKAGLVRSMRGAQGGYALAYAPNDITVGMILRILEGSLAPVDCVACEPPNCARASKCVAISVWQKMKDAIEGVVDHITLADLVEEQKDKNVIDFNI